MKDATQGVKNFFKNPRKVRPPRFKKRSNRQSFRIVGSASFDTKKLNHKWGAVKLPKLGWVKYRTERELPSTPTSVTIIRTPSGEYQASFVVEIEPTKLAPTTQAVGVDMGLTDYATTVNTMGEVGKIVNPRYYRNSQKKLAILQQAHARKTKGSKNREKARLKVAKQHDKIVNQRKDFINKLVTVLVSENQTISTETLTINHMVKNRKLAKSIMDASWGLFLTTLTQKCEETGRTHYQLPANYPSTKLCSNCGYKNNTLPLKDRTWDCPDCKIVWDRDINAALNMLLASGSVGEYKRLFNTLVLTGTISSKLLQV